MKKPKFVFKFLVTVFFKTDDRMIVVFQRHRVLQNQWQSLWIMPSVSSEKYQTQQGIAKDGPFVSVPGRFINQWNPLVDKHFE